MCNIAPLNTLEKKWVPKQRVWCKLLEHLSISKSFALTYLIFFVQYSRHTPLTPLFLFYPQHSEDALHELVPSIDKMLARHVSSLLASSKEFETLDEFEGLHGRIKKLANKILDNIERRRRRRHQKRRRLAQRKRQSYHYALREINGRLE